MKNMTKALIIAAALLYFMSPVDIMPGSILDDVLVIALALAKSKEVTKKNNDPVIDVD